MKITNVKKVKLSDLTSFYQENIDLFICCVSFESRCLSVAEAITQTSISNSLVCYSENSVGLGSKFVTNKSVLFKQFENSVVEVPMKLSDPIFTANSFVNSFNKLDVKGIRTCVIDITTFTHEALLILIRVLTIFFHNSECKITFIYAAAKEYSVGDSQATKWLTEGVGDVRSILGYAGNMNPAKAIHLVILLGFEEERARKLIDIFEPSKVSFGIGKKSTSVNETHYKVNKFNFRNLTIRREEVNQFSFSCTDPDETHKNLKQYLSKYREFNTIIATLNTKLSTLGVFLYCLEFPETQICYAAANKYNIRGYSSADDFCYIYTPNILSSFHVSQ
ncbi:hypothetical protein [Fibrella aquatilis]|uniref:Uncharacterized protein n=1 Tax=Fibrella aquatilis TaxID=2817059 RepID=A0A939G7N9_9BACT|nr:hypothetical protein [Fibrella aquatilis]MBO0931890.1 hypothetical protein [Fibrella aquatilis]